MERRFRETVEMNGGGGYGARGSSTSQPQPPPGGMAGLSQQTAASQLVTLGGGGRAPTRYRGMSRVPGGRPGPRRNPKRRAPAAPRRGGGGRKRNGKPARLVKGSPAAKRYMAKIRKLAHRGRRKRK